MPPQSIELIVDYGKLDTPSLMTAAIDGPVQFDNGLNTMTDKLDSIAATRSPSIRRQARSQTSHSHSQSRS